MKHAFIHLYPSAKSVESATVGRRRKHKQPRKKRKEKKENPAAFPKGASILSDTVCCRKAELW